jgi:hypothetical protein
VATFDRGIAEHIAVGTLSLERSAELANAPSAQKSLVHGFGWVMLYGGVGVWILGALSWLTFGAHPRAPQET